MKLICKVYKRKFTYKEILKNNYYNIGLFILIAIGGYFISLFISPFMYKIKRIKDNN